MSKTIFDAAARADLLARVDRLDAGAPARWGKFTAPRMVSHLLDALRSAMGELAIRRRRSILGNRVVRYLVIYILPFPRGAPTAPELLARAPASWPDDIASLKSALERAAALGRTGAWSPHPVFGDLSADAWGVLIYRHMSHHLSQFGV